MSDRCLLSAMDKDGDGVCHIVAYRLLSAMDKDGDGVSDRCQIGVR